MTANGNDVQFTEERISWIVVGLGVLGELFILVHAVFVRETLFHYFIASALMLAVLTAFSSVIVVTSDFIYVRWGLGLIGKVLSLAELHAKMVVPNRSISAWIYNPLGDTALEIRSRDGDRLVLAAADPKKLQRLLDIRR